MSSVYDWVTMAIFAGLVILFLQRSMGPPHPTDKIYHYAPPALGCAIANYLGNHGQKAPAIVLAIVVVGYILFFLKPFDRG